MQRTREAEYLIKKEINDEGKIDFNAHFEKIIHNELFFELNLGPHYKGIMKD